MNSWLVIELSPNIGLAYIASMNAFVRESLEWVDLVVSCTNEVIYCTLHQYLTLGRQSIYWGWMVGLKDDWTVDKRLTADVHWQRRLPVADDRLCPLTSMFSVASGLQSDKRVVQLTGRPNTHCIQYHSKACFFNNFPYLYDMTTITKKHSNHNDNLSTK